nr:BtrH N-terminal domain-containing protein [Bacillus subtilis]
MILYIGNGHYCYSNSAAMFLSSIGEHVSPQMLEVLTGVGLGAMLENGKTLFLSMRDPDDGINCAFNILGIDAEEHQQADCLEAPFSLLKKQIARAPVLLGPLNMGELTYLPNHKHLNGADHYVLGYDMDNQSIYLHDPAGFPYVPLTLEQFKKAWKADDIPYCKGHFKYWSSPKKTHSLHDNEIYKKTIMYFKKTYQEFENSNLGLIGKDAILHYAEQLRHGPITQEMIDHTTYFLFQLSAKRANDFAFFFENKATNLSKIKNIQAETLGLCHDLSVNKQWSQLSEKLQTIADIEDRFRSELFKTSI